VRSGCGLATTWASHSVPADAETKRTMLGTHSVATLATGQRSCHASVASAYSKASGPASPTLNMRHVTKWAEPLTMGRAIPEVMRRAFFQLRNGRPEPVLIEVPVDVFGEQVPDWWTPEASFTSRTAPDPAAIAQAAAVLAAAERPVIYAGQGVHYARAWEALKTLAEDWNIPVTTSIEGKSALPGVRRYSAPTVPVTTARSHLRNPFPHCLRLFLAVALGGGAGALAAPVSSAVATVSLPTVPLQPARELRVVHQGTARTLPVRVFDGVEMVLLEELAAALGGSTGPGGSERQVALYLDGIGLDIGLDGGEPGGRTAIRFDADPTAEALSAGHRARVFGLIHWPGGYVPSAIGGGTLWRDVAAELYPAEAECIRSELGAEAYEALLGEPVLAGGTALTELPAGCLEQSNAVELVVAYLDAKAGGLSPESETCLRQTFAVADFGLIARASDAPDDGGASALGAAIGSAIGLAFCLNDEEAALVSVGDLADDPALDFSVAQFACIVERVDVEQLLLTLAAPADGGGGDESPAVPAEFFQALSECAVAAGSPDG